MTGPPKRNPTGLEPALGRAANHSLTGNEPVLGGERRIDPRILDRLRRSLPVSGRLVRGCSQSSLPPAERGRHARALLAQLRAIAPDHHPPPHLGPRELILLALGTLGDPAALPDLIAALHDDSFAVRRAAIRALGCLAHPAGVTPLLDLLDESLRDRTSITPFLVVDTLGRLGIYDPDRVVPRLLDLLDSDVWPDLKLCTLTALGRIGDPRAVQPLIRTLHTHGDFRHRREAARALAHIDHESVLPALILALGDRYRDVRYSVAAALGRLGDPRAVQPLQMAYLNERVARVRLGIERALAELDARPPGPDDPVPLPWFDTFWQPDTPLET